MDLTKDQIRDLQPKKHLVGKDGAPTNRTITQSLGDMIALFRILLTRCPKTMPTSDEIKKDGKKKISWQVGTLRNVPGSRASVPHVAYLQMGDDSMLEKLRAETIPIADLVAEKYPDFCRMKWPGEVEKDFEEAMRKDWVGIFFIVFCRV